MKVRNFSFGCVLSILVLCASVGVNETKASAAACPALSVITYYTDASMTVVCGVWDLCSGKPSLGVLNDFVIASSGS